MVKLIFILVTLLYPLKTNANILNLDLTCKTSGGIEQTSDFREVEVPKNKTFSLSVKVEKAKPVKSASKYFPDLDKKITIFLDRNSSALPSWFIQIYVGMSKINNRPIITEVSEKEISIVGIQTKNGTLNFAEDKKPDYQWNFSLDRYTGNLSLMGIYIGQSKIPYMIRQYEASCSRGKQKF